MNVPNGKRPFISLQYQGHGHGPPEDLNTSTFLTIPFGDYRYVNEADFQSYIALRLPISEDVNMNNKKIINCKEGDNDDDICTIKNLSVYYSKRNLLDINNNRIINYSEVINENDVCTIKNLRSNMSTYHMIQKELNMRNQRITGVEDEMALNDAVNVNQLNNLSRNFR